MSQCSSIIDFSLMARRYNAFRNNHFSTINSNPRSGMRSLIHMSFGRKWMVSQGTMTKHFAAAHTLTMLKIVVHQTNVIRTDRMCQYINCAYLQHLVVRKQIDYVSVKIVIQQWSKHHRLWPIVLAKKVEDISLDTTTCMPENDVIRYWYCSCVATNNIS